MRSVQCLSQGLWTLRASSFTAKLRSALPGRSHINWPKVLRYLLTCSSSSNLSSTFVPYVCPVWTSGVLTGLHDPSTPECGRRVRHSMPYATRARGTLSTPPGAAGPSTSP
eukprot:6394673-Heterocapsa_arctica.AAC.1